MVEVATCVRGFLAMEGKFDRKYPFLHCKIDDPSFLNEVEGRLHCQKCKKSRKFFCYSCNIALKEFKGQVPKVKVGFEAFLYKKKSILKF